MKAWGLAGNDHRTIGLWKYGIPTLIDYNHYVTPPEYLVLSRTLARPIDRQLRNIMALTLPDASILQALGVRFVISDRSMGDNFRLREVINWGPASELRLYELSKPNLWNYSPTSVLLARNAGDVLEILKNGFDFRHSAVITVPLTETLVPALSTELRFERSTLHIHATSIGRSMLVLPVQFSRCLEISSVISNADVRLLRVNLLQAAVFFSSSLDADITFRSGPFGHSTCRLRDIEDMRVLDIASAAKRFPLDSRVNK
jgi:hypothetical protein